MPKHFSIARHFPQPQHSACSHVLAPEPSVCSGEAGHQAFAHRPAGLRPCEPAGPAGLSAFGVLPSPLNLPPGTHVDWFGPTFISPLRQRRGPNHDPLSLMFLRLGSTLFRAKPGHQTSAHGLAPELFVVPAKPATQLSCTAPRAAPRSGFM